MAQHKKKIGRTHVARIDLSEKFKDYTQPTFSLKLEIIEKSGYKADYIFEGISAVNVQAVEPVSSKFKALEKQDADKIWDTSLILEDKIQPYKLFRIASLNWEDEAKYLTCYHNKGVKVHCSPLQDKG